MQCQHVHTSYLSHWQETKIYFTESLTSSSNSTTTKQCKLQTLHPPHNADMDLTPLPDISFGDCWYSSSSRCSAEPALSTPPSPLERLCSANFSPKRAVYPAPFLGPLPLPPIIFCKRSFPSGLVPPQDAPQSCFTPWAALAPLNTDFSFSCPSSPPSVLSSAMVEPAACSLAPKFSSAEFPSLRPSPCDDVPGELSMRAKSPVSNYSPSSPPSALAHVDASCPPLLELHAMTSAPGSPVLAYVDASCPAKLELHDITSASSASASTHLPRRGSRSAGCQLAGSFRLGSDSDALRAGPLLFYTAAGKAYAKLICLCTRLTG